MLKIKLSTPETKPFYLTSEFWLLIGSGINTVASGPQNKEALILNGLAAAYAVARGLAKAGTPAVPQPTEALPSDLPVQAEDPTLIAPPGDGAGLKAVDAPPSAAAPAADDPLAIVREQIAEHPEIIQTLKGEGVIS